MDQLSIDKFDVEHIAPKEQMKKLISETSGSGLPISCIANLCYLPEYINRSKRDRNFYQDTKYLQHINLDEVEQKYSFTTRTDLEWMDMDYSGADDFDALKEFYEEFCNNRFAILKKLFCESMGIDYEAMISVSDEPINTINISINEITTNSNDFVSNCAKRIEEKTGILLQKAGRSVYKSQDGKKGYIFCVSKAYRQGNRDKYWYGYRLAPLEDISDCQEKYMVYGFKNSDDVLLIPVSYMDSVVGFCNYSTDDAGQVSHWHIVFFRKETGHMVQLLSKPDIREVDIDKYKI